MRFRFTMMTVFMPTPAFALSGSEYASGSIGGLIMIAMVVGAILDGHFRDVAHTVAMWLGTLGCWAVFIVVALKYNLVWGFAAFIGSGLLLMAILGRVFRDEAK